MAKRVFKNKRLMRSLLILAGFFIVGFFLWTMLFKNTKIFEGQATFDEATLMCNIDEFNELRTCMTGKLGISLDEFDNATRTRMPSRNEVNELLRTYMNTRTSTPSTTASSTAVNKHYPESQPKGSDTVAVINGICPPNWTRFGETSRCQWGGAPWFKGKAGCNIHNWPNQKAYDDCINAS